MIKKHLWKIVVLVVIILIAGSVVYSKQVTSKANEGVAIEVHQKGNHEAQITLVEYSDFECSACGQFYPYVKDIINEYNDELNFEYRHFPLSNIHDKAIPAAKASEAAAQQGKFWEMHDKLFENQSTWSKSTNASTYFNQYAEEIGLDMDKFKLHLNSSIIANAVDAGFADARSRDFTGTPTFLLNDEKMTFSTFEEFREVIEAAIEASKEAS